jgi:hypothetical protein
LDDDSNVFDRDSLLIYEKLKDNINIHEALYDSTVSVYYDEVKKHFIKRLMKRDRFSKIALQECINNANPN